MRTATADLRPSGSANEISHAALQELISEARMIEIGHRDLDGSTVITVVLPGLCSLFERALLALGDLEAASGEELSDLCWVVREDLRTSQERLGLLEHGTAPFALFAMAEEAASKLLEGLCAVEGQLASNTGARSISQRLDLRLHPLRVRRLVARFRQRMRQAVSMPEGSHLETMLRRFGSSLAWLRGKDDFSQIRASDRLLAQELQERILAWFQSPERDESDGRHIRDELEAFVSMLDLVNHRQEIVQHDIQAVDEAIRLLSDVPGISQPRCVVMDRLVLILGRDDRLDQMLAEGADCATLLERLVVIRADLGNAEPPSKMAQAGEAGEGSLSSQQQETSF